MMMLFFRVFFIVFFALIFESASQAAAQDNVAVSFDEVMAFMGTKPKPDVTKNGIGIYVYDGMYALDAINPYQVFKSAGLKVFMIAQKKGTITTSSKLTINVDKSIDEVDKLDILVIPGGATEAAAQTKDTVILDWIRKIDKTTIYTTSVCTGAWILGSTGLLKGKKATTHWYRAEEMLTKYGAKYQKKRWVQDGKYWTSAGVTAGADMSLAIVLKLFGKDYTQAVMLDLEYDPKPPVSYSTTTPKVKSIMEYMYDYYLLPFVKTGELGGEPVM
ncbi:MAG: DJ-1/PfpI family protein [Methylococcales bacterium]|nr:DJ-1/PfpI family protein [Methylococcales bacterium]MDD5753698.1 DJ-1/PfpI family protein [Methylococcales bacterium]